ncbi:DUF4041 domain-containing protein [Nocardia takedensis]|uniref:DUF4041 domain-containing protein n=1 Tax=Nocardia takedensis TaxID=259390 RepID=UPI003F758C24
MFGSRAYAKQQGEDLASVRAELDRLRAQMAGSGVLEVAELERLRDGLAAQVTEQQAVLDELRARIVTTREAEILQEIGIYEYRHPLSDAVAYRDELARLQGEIKHMARRDGGAIEASKTWVVEGSVTEGRRMIQEYSKLMLRAYNVEADNLVRAMKPYKLASAVKQLDKAAFTIERLGKTMLLRVAPRYHQLRVRELEMTADHLELVARDKQRDREERARLKEEEKVQQELAREREKLETEQQHYRNALAAVEANGDLAGAEKLRTMLAELERRINDVDYRKANIRAGYVYVISNIGAFGEGVVKIGLTRRLEPMDRIRELNNASVPFKFDVHVRFFSDDAVGIEAQMHRRLAHKRVNRVNTRREFFYATPAEACAHLKELTGNLLQFDEEAEALEYRQGLNVERRERSA